MKIRLKIRTVYTLDLNCYSYSNIGCCSGCSGIADKIVQEITPLGTLNYTYDAIGRRTSMTVSGQPTVNYTYDANSRLTGISTVHPTLGTLSFDIDYDAVGRRTSLLLPNGVTTNYSYDNARTGNKWGHGVRSIFLT